MSTQHALMEQMRDLHLSMHRLYNERMRNEGASLARLKVLALIARCGPIRSIDIAEMLGQAPRTVTEALDGLERDEMVIRQPDPDDRRAKRISLTDAGRDVLLAVEPHREAFMVQFFDPLTDRDQAELLRILTTLNNRLIEMGAPAPPAELRQQKNSSERERT